MPSVVHVVTTANFAGVERYVSEVARETSYRGWRVAVVGGHPKHMPLALGGAALWLPGASAAQALRSLRRLGRRDLCHAHMTVAEAVAVAARPVHRGPVVATRHFAAHRGTRRTGRLLAPWIARGLQHEIAVSEFVASQLERRPDAVLLNGVPLSPCLWSSSNRNVLVLQRLEPEKDTLTALRAWKASGLGEEGWRLRVAGEGSERAALEAWAESEGIASVTFAGWVWDVAGEFSSTGVLLAPAPAEPCGLAVIEAMAAGVPVVASAAGGHLETVGQLLPDVPLFAPGDVSGAAGALRSLLADSRRARLSEEGRHLITLQFTVARHVESLVAEYDRVLRREPGPVNEQAESGLISQ